MDEKKVKEKKEEPSAKKDLAKENQALIKENEALKKEADDYKDKWMRNVAEFDNYKKRNAKLWQDAFFEGKAEVINKILTVGDNLDRAMSMELDEKTMEGLKNIKRQFDETLVSLEVSEINPKGEKFDPNIAEAVMQVEAEGESDTVKDVYIKGYKLKEKIIRYAKVSVIK